MTASRKLSDVSFMQRALQAARKGAGKTHPNPAVGAVLVNKEKILATGFHRRAGLPHAEIEALMKVPGQARGATLYVTLEPCSHTGRTPPCTDAIIAAGIKRVVVGCRDQHPLVNGKGIARLRRAGIQVQTGVCQDECLTLNKAFFTWAAQSRPWVTMKAASTLDGIIGQSKTGKAGVTWITGPEARLHAHKLRAGHDGILVGVATVLADDPALTLRLPGHHSGKNRPQPFVRFVMDSDLRTPPGARLFDGGPIRQSPVVVITGKPKASWTTTRRKGFEARRQKLLQKGAAVWDVAADQNGRPKLQPALQTMASRLQIQSLLVEGGATIHGAFVAAGLVDGLALFLAPRLAGGGVTITKGPGRSLADALPLGPAKITHLGDDLLLEAEVLTNPARKKSQDRATKP